MTLKVVSLQVSPVKRRPTTTTKIEPSRAGERARNVLAEAVPCPLGKLIAGGQQWLHRIAEKASTSCEREIEMQLVGDLKRFLAKVQ